MSNFNELIKGLEDVCNGYYAGKEWNSKEDEEQTKETFKSAYKLALRHMRGIVIDNGTITRLEVINHAKNGKDIGRLLTLHKELNDFTSLEVDLQDNKRTMKIFLS